jgi:hypothetical protein
MDGIETLGTSGAHQAKTSSATAYRHVDGVANEAYARDDRPVTAKPRRTDDADVPPSSRRSEPKFVRRRSPEPKK